MLKKISGPFALTTAILLLSFLLKAQDKNSSASTSSPYSRYGIGTLSGYSQGRSAAMGGTAIGTRYGFQINTANPASYTAIDSMTFLMEFGIMSKHVIYETTDKKNGDNLLNFNHITFSIPLKNWWAMAFGLLPYSSKGYEIVSTEVTTNATTSTSITGSGTLSKAFIGNAFNIGKNLSIGFNTWYLFGTLSDTYYLYFPNDAAAYDYLLLSKLNVHNFGVTTGIQYTWKTRNKNGWTLGAVFEPKKNMNTRYIVHEERVLFRNSSTNSPIVDTITHVVDYNKGLTFPLTYGGGFTYSYKNKYILGGDIYHQDWSEASYMGNTSAYLTNSTRYSSGMEIVPNMYSIRSYWSRVQYRFGGFYEKSYLKINGQQINGYGLTFGFGLPFSRALSTLNVSAELGRLGTTENNLVRESYAKMTFHLLLHDRWFIKRKFD
jgi:hypothetical protein